MRENVDRMFQWLLPLNKPQRYRNALLDCSYLRPKGIPWRDMWSRDTDRTFFTGPTELHVRVDMRLEQLNELTREWVNPLERKFNEAMFRLVCDSDTRDCLTRRIEIEDVGL